jgi:hypothetical protein
MHSKKVYHWNGFAHLHTYPAYLESRASFFSAVEQSLKV